MQECEFKILENKMIAKEVFLMKLDGDCSEFTAPGQFCEIKIPGKYLRRPISVCDVSENTLTLIYKVLGEGTEELSCMEEGEYLSILTGLRKALFSAAAESVFPLSTTSAKSW